MKRSHEPTITHEEDDNPLKAILKKSKKPKVDESISSDVKTVAATDVVENITKTENLSPTKVKSEVGTSQNIDSDEKSKPDIDEQKYVEDLLEDDFDSKRKGNANDKSKTADSIAIEKAYKNQKDSNPVSSKEKKKDKEKKDKKEKKRESKSPEKKSKQKEKVKIEEDDIDDEIGTVLEIILNFLVMVFSVLLFCVFMTSYAEAVKYVLFLFD